MSLVANHLGLWWSVISCTLAAVLVVWGAMRGVIEHRIPRMLLGVAVAVIAASYWWEVFADLPAAAEARRGAGWIMWPALGWVAWSGVRYSRSVVAHTRELIGDE